MSETMHWEKAGPESELGSMYALHEGDRENVGVFWHTRAATEIAAQAETPLQWGPAVVRCDGVEGHALALTGTSREPGEEDAVAVFVARQSVRDRVRGLAVPPLDGHELPPLPGEVA